MELDILGRKHTSKSSWHGLTWILRYDTKAQAKKKEKIDESGVIKIKNFCASKDTIKVKRQSI